MDVLAQRRQLSVRADHVLAHVLGMGTRVTDPVDAADRIELLEQLRERSPSLTRKVAAVGVDVLAEQGDLANALGRQPARLGEQFVRRTTHLSPPSRRHDAI